MIVRICFSNGEVMMFGDSYKPWDMQAREFLRYNPALKDGIILIEKSKDKWVSWGGLKWCPESSFQEYLNREGVQQHEDDNPRPRQFGDMKFTEDRKLIEKLNQ